MGERRARYGQLLILVLAAVGLASGVLYLVRPGAISDVLQASARSAGSRISGSIDSPLAAALNGVEVAVAALLAAALALRASRRRDAMALAFMLAIWTVPLVFLPVLGVAPELAAALVTPQLCVLGGAFLRFAALFPRPLTPADLAEARRRARPGRARRVAGRVAHAMGAPLRWPTRGVLALAGRRTAGDFRLRTPIAAALLRAKVVWGATALLLLIAAYAEWRGVMALRGLLPLAPALAVLQGLAFLLASYRLAEGSERRSLLWVVQGFYAGVWVLAVFSAIYLWQVIAAAAHAPHARTFTLPGGALMLFYAGNILSTFLVLAGLALAIFYTGTFDPSLALRKTTVYGVLTVVAAFLFAVLEETIANTFQNWLHLSNGVGAGVAGAAVALTVGSLKDRIARQVERRLPTADAAAAGRRHGDAANAQPQAAPSP